MKIHSEDYKRGLATGPAGTRQPRKDKGVKRTNMHRLLARVGALTVEDEEFSSEHEDADALVCPLEVDSTTNISHKNISLSTYNTDCDEQLTDTASQITKNVIHGHINSLHTLIV